MSDDIEIHFENEEKKEEFTNLYNGHDHSGFYPNYSKGWVGPSSLDKTIYLERDKIESFKRLAQDLEMHDGKIR